MNFSYKSGIYWYRRDLRIGDHKILKTASQQCAAVFPLYILTAWKQQHQWTGANRQQFLCECLASLAANLNTIEGRLIIRHGNALDELRKMIIETQADVLYFQLDPDPHGKLIEKAVKVMCEEMGVKVHAEHDVSLHSPDEILTGGAQPYRVYTPYSKNWLAKPKDLPVTKISSLRTPPHISSDPLPTLAWWGLKPNNATTLEGGEKAARQRFHHALASRIGEYQKCRDIPALNATSRISQDLRHGLLSLRSIYASIQSANEAASSEHKNGIHIYLKELAWREFYFAILHYYPEVLESEFSPQWRGLPWDQPDEKLVAWQLGRTGFPIVDAGMRELLATGHMHNRVRMIVAMFFTKDLHYDWRIGESWFMQHLIDGEIASNNGGWQWSAGTGADAAPYFRIQNPWSQTARFDPQGIYIKRWVPELADISADKFHQAPIDGRPIATDYPLPICDHNRERLRTLALFKKHKDQQR